MFQTTLHIPYSPVINSDIEIRFVRVGLHSLNIAHCLYKTEAIQQVKLTLTLARISDMQTFFKRFTSKC